MESKEEMTRFSFLEFSFLNLGILFNAISHSPSLTKYVVSYQINFKEKMNSN